MHRYLAFFLQSFVRLCWAIAQVRCAGGTEVGNWGDECSVKLCSKIHQPFLENIDRRNWSDGSMEIIPTVIMPYPKCLCLAPCHYSNGELRMSVTDLFWGSSKWLKSAKRFGKQAGKQYSRHGRTKARIMRRNPISNDLLKSAVLWKSIGAASVQRQI